jgi:hypothetical protein
MVCTGSRKAVEMMEFVPGTEPASAGTIKVVDAFSLGIDF